MLHRFVPPVIAVCLCLAACGDPPPNREPEALPPPPPVNAGLEIVEPADTLSPQDPVRQLAVEASRQRFVLPPGYRIEPVLTEPHVKEPAAIAFDGNGRMFVLELRSYMQDLDATDELAPVSRISLHEDTDRDGVYDRHHVFVDSLVFARFVMPFDENSILAMESNEDDVFRYIDTDGDGTADKRELFTSNFGRAGNVEHQQAFLTWGMDNWLYSTYNAFRVRWTPDGILREPTGPNHAQWGVTQDDDGKIWFQGGASGLPSYFQFPIHYGHLDVENEFEAGFEVPYGLAGVGDFQPGPRFARADGTLNRVTGAAGNDVFRGHRLPEGLVGDYLYGEPVARIVRRIRPVESGGLTELRNLYQPQQAEFIRSTDPLFRPVDLATAPDGTLYIVDMYRGIIQEGQWTPPGSFLREKIEQYALDEAIGHGRIWRLTHDGIERDARQPRMHDESAAELVRHLGHPNGWWRDTAQRLLVLRQDASVVPALERLVRRADFLPARFHALWTLEGLGRLDPDLVRDQFDGPEPRMRIQAVRASETLYKSGDTTFADDYRRLARDPDPSVAIQALLTLNTLDVPDHDAVIRAAMAADTTRGIQVVGAQLLAEEDPASRFAERLPEAERALFEQGRQAYDELCAQCHGANGRGTPLGEGLRMAPRLAGSPHVQGHPAYLINTLLHGLTGPIDGETYPGNLMLPMGEQPDAWIAGVASYVRNSFTNDAGMVSAADVARLRAATADRDRPWTQPELIAATPVRLEPGPDWTVTASHASAQASAALNFEGWNSEAPQRPGMWFQIAFPAPVRLAELRFETTWQRRGPGPDAPPAWSTEPRGYRVEVSADGARWTAVAEGQGRPRRTVIGFEPVAARFMRLTQTADVGEGPNWAMRDLRVYALP